MAASAAEMPLLRICGMKQLASQNFVNTEIALRMWTRHDATQTCSKAEIVLHRWKIRNCCQILGCMHISHSIPKGEKDAHNGMRVSSMTTTQPPAACTSQKKLRMASKPRQQDGHKTTRRGCEVDMHIISNISEFDNGQIARDLASTQNKRSKDEKARRHSPTRGGLLTGESATN